MTHNNDRPNGDIALFAEGRHDNCNDEGGHTDIVFKISKDNGKSFGPLHVRWSVVRYLRICENNIRCQHRGSAHSLHTEITNDFNDSPFQK